MKVMQLAKNLDIETCNIVIRVINECFRIHYSTYFTNKGGCAPCSKT